MKRRARSWELKPATSARPGPTSLPPETTLSKPSETTVAVLIPDRTESDRESKPNIGEADSAQHSITRVPIKPAQPIFAQPASTPDTTPPAVVTAERSVEEEPAPEGEAHQATSPALRAGGLVQRSPDGGSPPGDPPPLPPSTPPGEPTDSGPAGAKGSTTITIKASTRDISASNLTALWDAMTRSGTRESASVLPKLTPAPLYEYDEKDKVTKATIKVVEEKEMPNWVEADKQCPPIKAEWTRFIRVLDQHEDRHIAIDKKHYENVHTKLVGKQREDAWAAMDAVVAAADKANEDYDNQSGHGVKEGANINTAVQCAPEKVPNATTDSPPSTSDAPPPSGGFLSEVANAVGSLIQPQLEVGAPDDPLEHEADRAAAAIERDQPVVVTGRADQSTARRHCAAPGPCDCAACRAAKGASTDQIVEPVLARGTGAPLDSATRRAMETRFGHDFGQVRIHADQGAAQSAHSLHARAYTVGSDIVFGSGQYRPQAPEGRRLIAHELTHVVQQSTATPSHRRALQRQPDAGAPPGPTDAGAPADGTGYVTLEGKDLALNPQQQRRDMEQVVAQKGRAGPRDFLQEWELIYDRARPLAGVPDNQSELDRARKALDSLRDVVTQLENDIDSFLTDFDSTGRGVLGEVLKDSRTRATAEGIKYGLTEEIISEIVADPNSGYATTIEWTKYNFKDSKSSAIAGISEAATQLLKRRAEKIEPIKARLSRHTEDRIRRSSPGGGYYAPAKTAEHLADEKALEDEERSYDVLANELATRYPVLGSFTRDKEDDSALRRLASGGNQGTAQLIGGQVADTLRKIKLVEEENKPGGGVNIFKIAKIVALTKGRKQMAPNSWESKVVDDRIKAIHDLSAATGIAVGLLQLALVLLAPATGGATLVVAAGLSTAVAVGHAQEYMLEEAMAGSDVDKARALSQEEPSLFWLAVDVVAAVADVGAGAAAAAKLINTWRTAASAVRAIEAAKTAEELAAARRALTEQLGHEPELLARITKSIEKDGRLAKLSEEAKAVESVVDKAAKAELKSGVELATEGGHIHVTDNGRVFSCSSPCTEMRAKYSELLASEEGKGLMGDLVKLEEDSAKAVAEGKKGADLKPLAERAKNLDDALGKAMTQARAKKIAAWLETVRDTYPVLKEHPLDAAAIERIIKKANPDHIKGQILEELMGAKLKKMIASGDKGLEALAGGRPIEKLEYVAGHRVTDSTGRQFTDGMLIVRDGEKVEVVAVIESKAGKASAAGLAGERTSLRPDGTYKSLKELGAERPIKELTDAELALIEGRRKAIEDLRKANPTKYKGMSIEAIDEMAEHQADIAKAMDQIVKTEAGQAVQDIERMVSVGFKIDDTPVKVAKGGRGSTKVVGVLPEDVPGKGLEAKIGSGTPAKPGQGVNFASHNVGINSKELNALGSEISARATAPAL